jgi:hypothetical protein
LAADARAADGSAEGGGLSLPARSTGLRRIDSGPPTTSGKLLIVWSNGAMNAGSEPLSDDIAALRAMLVAAWAERDAERAEKEQIVTERDQLAAQNDRLRHLIRKRGLISVADAA